MLTYADVCCHMQMPNDETLAALREASGSTVGEGNSCDTVLSLLALLVQKYKY